MAQTLQEWMFGGIPPGKKQKQKQNTQPVMRCLLRGKGNTEWTAEDSSCKYQL